MKYTSSIVATLLTVSFAGAANADTIAGVQGLYAKNYLVTDGGVDYSVMDVFIRWTSSFGTGTNGERVTNVFGQATTDAASSGVDKTSWYQNSKGLSFQQSNTTWLPGSSVSNGWDSFVTVGIRNQGTGNSSNVSADAYFTNPNSNTGFIVGGSNSVPAYVGAGWYQASPLDSGFETNVSVYADKMIMIGRFSLKVSDIVAAGGAAPVMKVWTNFSGKTAAQTGGTTLYTIAAMNLKSDANTSYTTSSRTWNLTPTFTGVVQGQAAWTFYAPTPGAATLLGLASFVLRRRK